MPARTLRVVISAADISSLITKIEKNEELDVCRSLNKYMQALKEYQRLLPRGQSYSKIETAKLELAEIILERLNYPSSRSYEPQPEPRLIKQEALKQLGFVYILKAENGHVKIGKTKGLHSRISTLRSTSPINLELIHSIECENYSFLERQLHEKFIEKRIKGEWFLLSQEDIDWLKELR